MQLPEVRFHHLRPQQFVERREQCAAVYIPLGCMEWHGEHNPVGLDGLVAEELSIRCAQRGGGLVFPTLYYAENRHTACADARESRRVQIAEHYRVPPDVFTSERYPHDEMQQAENTHRLLLHILAQAETMGFKVGVLVVGHGPWADWGAAAAHTFNKRSHTSRNGMLAYVATPWLLLREFDPQAGDHAGFWETSLMMAAQADTVDLDLLGPKVEGQTFLGVSTRKPVQDANGEFGGESLDVAAELINKEVAHRLSHQHLYRPHGMTHQQGLWKQDET